MVLPAESRLRSGLEDLREPLRLRGDVLAAGGQVERSGWPVPGGEAAHLDLYRLGDATELDFLGLDALAADATLWLVEWPERGATGLPAPDLAIDLAVDGDGRTAVLKPASKVGADWLARTPS